LTSAQPFASGLLAPKVLVQAAALGFVSIDAQMHRFVADRKESGNLLRAPVAADIGLNALLQASQQTTLSSNPSMAALGMNA
jgi:hypothetical protein